jgi:hypothetical protein
LSPFKFLFAEGFTGLKLIAFNLDGKKLSAFPATVWTLIGGLNQRETAPGTAFGAFYGYHHGTTFGK